MDLNHKSITRIDQYLARGINVFPVIKSVSDWATVPQKSGTGDDRTSYPPKDREQYRKFLRALAQHFAQQNKLLSSPPNPPRGKVTLVAIEIEEHDPTFWGGTMSEYMDMLHDARYVLVSGFGIPVTDGGIQGSAMFWLIVNHHLNSNRVPDALQLYQDYRGGKTPSCATCLPACDGSPEAALRCELGDAKKVPSIANAFSSVTRLLDTVDVMNVHNFGSETLLPAAANYLRRQQPGKPMVMNAVGVAHDGSVGEYDTPAHFMVRQLTVALTLDLDRIIWYSAPNGDDNPCRLIGVGGVLMRDNLDAFTTLTRFLNRPLSVPEFASSPGEGIKRYSFVSDSHTTDVVWSIKPTTYPVPSGCKAFDSSGAEISSAILTLERRNPFYVRCRRSGASGVNPW